jgi:lambda family phage portal protein
MGFAQRVASFFTGSSRPSANFGFGSRAYDAGRYDDPRMAGWTPQLAHPDDEVLTTRDQVVGRARDLARNHPIIVGAVDRKAEAVVGPNIRLEAQPDYETMGRNADWADDWATGVESQWNVYANDSRKLCDAARVSTFGGLVETAYRHWMIDGEACAQVLAIDRGAPFKTAVQLIDPDRLSNPNNLAEGMVLVNGNRVYGGVEVDQYGAAVAYHIRTEHPGDPSPTFNKFTWIRVLREGPTGTAKFIHAYRPGRAGQRRGVSKLAAAIKLTRIGDKLDLATLDAAILNAFMAVSMESPAPTGDVADAMAPGTGSVDSSWLDGLISFRKEKPVVFRDGPSVMHTFPGEKANVLTSEHPNGNYPAFEAALLRKVAAATGLSYPQLSQNWADINYSSARTLLNEIWRSLLHDRWFFTQAFCTPIFAAWLEEAVLIGRVMIAGGWPNFYKWRAELTICEWYGPGRGTIDPKKESDADETNLHLNSTTLADIGADTGKDPRKVAQRRAREKRMLTGLGLTDITDVARRGQVGRPADAPIEDPTNA